MNGRMDQRRMGGPTQDGWTNSGQCQLLQTAVLAALSIKLYNCLITDL